jgi:hypothetical protein
MAKVHVSFTLDTEEDKRLVRWLDGLPKGQKSEAIREALANHLSQNGITLRDIYEAIQDLKRGGLVVTQESGGPQSDVPADVLDNLANLGL